jgi:hypothetical protein
MSLHLRYELSGVSAFFTVIFITFHCDAQRDTCPARESPLSVTSITASIRPNVETFN